MAPRLARRSRRLGNITRKYTDDAFEAAGLSPESPDSEQLNSGRQQSEAASDDEFVMAEDYRQTNAEEDEEEEEEDAEEDEEEEADSDEGRSMIGPAIAKTWSAKREALAHTEKHIQHSRGLPKPSERGSKRVHLNLTFGTGVEDIIPILYTRDNWGFGRDSTFPSVESLRNVRGATTYGIGDSFCYDQDKLTTESTQAWDWYYDKAIGGRLLRNQHFSVLGDDARQIYLPREKKAKHTILVGPLDNRQEYKLGFNEALDFGSAWETHKKASKKGSKRKPGTESVDHDYQIIHENERIREGWIINFGGKLQCVAWAPNCSGTTQYLAVAVPLSKNQKSSECDMKYTGAPAFTPSPPYPAAIQIWSFEAKQGDTDPLRLDMSIKPRLRLVLCSAFGDVKCLSWCPIPREFRTCGNDKDGYLNLGLLAGIWGDGTLKVFDVNVATKSERTQWLKVESPMFQAKPSSTMSTSLSWLSPTDIAVGCSNGFIAVWNLAASCAQPKVAPIPYIYTPVHSAYVLSVVSAYPNHPHLLASTSIDGHVKLCSLVDPLTDTTEGTRARLGTANLSYSPFLQAFMTSDESDFARLQLVRRFYSAISIIRTTSSITAITPCSPCHPTFLAGSAEGAVIATNPLKRLLNPKGSHFQQTWFTHNWVHSQNDENGERIGVSRFFDGFKAEVARLAKSAGQGKKPGNATKLYEEETGITALAFNPNIQCAGWTCAGLGCGLLRVEDLIHYPHTE